MKIQSRTLYDTYGLFLKYNISSMLCDEFRKISSIVWHILEAGFKTGYKVKEETITDLILLNLKVRFPHSIHVQSFTRDEESKNGADWEWWFTFKGGYIGFRVQAKIINRKNKKFSSLHSKVGRSSIYQSDLLVDASTKGVKTIPIYCLYSYFDDTETSRLHWKCGQPPKDFALLGCTVMSAVDIVNLRKTRKSNDAINLVNLAHPLHCLTCCKKYGGFAGANILTHLQRFAEQELLIGNIPEDIITTEPPKYVRNLVNDHNDNITYTKPDDTSLKGFVLVDLDKLYKKTIFTKYDNLDEN